MLVWRLKTVKVEICTKFPVENYVDFGEKCFLGFGRSPDGRVTVPARGLRADVGILRDSSSSAPAEDTEKFFGNGESGTCAFWKAVV